MCMLVFVCLIVCKSVMYLGMCVWDSVCKCVCVGLGLFVCL